MSTLSDWFGPRQPSVPVLPQTASEVTVCQQSQEVIVVHGRGCTERITGENATFAINALKTGQWHPTKPNSKKGTTQYWRNR